MSIQDTPKVMVVQGLGAGLAMAAMASAFMSPSYDAPLYRRDEPRKKSTHKRKFKGSKAAKKASRKRKG